MRSLGTFGNYFFNKVELQSRGSLAKAGMMDGDEIIGQLGVAAAMTTGDGRVRCLNDENDVAAGRMADDL